MSAPNIETIVSLSKRRGFVFPASDIYGGLGSSWDYGQLGVELANNIKRSWWNWLVYERDDIEGIDSSIIQNRLVWKYSGHEDTFQRSACRLPRLQCSSASGQTRNDADGKHICSNCGKANLTEPKDFNLMFRTTVGAASADDDPTALAYLRPETAQGIFINFKNVLDTSRRKLPFGIAQIGKAFRNEVTPGNFIFRTREFEQMEMEYFVPAGGRAARSSGMDRRFSGLAQIARDLGRKPITLRAAAARTGPLCRADGRYNVPLFPRTRGRGETVGRADGHREPQGF